MSCFSLMHRFRINKNLLLIKNLSCRTLIISRNILIITVISKETKNEKQYCVEMSRCFKDKNDLL